MSWRNILQKPSTTYQKNKENQKHQNKLTSNFSYISDFSCTEEMKEEFREGIKYLYFERLGISDNEELAIDEVINYAINKLTIH